jgi:hypothetical protein
MFLHSETKFWFPLGGDPIHSGEILRYGFGVSYLWYDSDSFAIIPTLEVVGWSVLSGQQTPANALAPVPIDGLDILHLLPGCRFVFDSAGDLGMWDMGISSGFGLTNQDWYDGMLRVDFRLQF